MRLMAAIFFALLTAVFATQAQAKHHKHHHRIADKLPIIAQGCEYGNDGHVVCQNQPNRTETHRIASRHIARKVQLSSYHDDVIFIPNPPGTWRVVSSCAHRLAAYWGLGKGLDKVSTWPRVFARTYSPAVGIAAVRRDQHHIMGIIGGGPGAWRVADFNSGGHRNREYTVASFGGYFFVDPRMKVASR